MAATDVRTIPATIRLASTMTPNEMRALKIASGRPLGELLGGDPEDMELAPDRTQAMAWVALRRAGYDATWEQAGDVAPDTSEGPPVDPSNGARSTGSSTSAGTGT